MYFDYVYNILGTNLYREVIKTRQNLQKPSFLICKSGVKNKVIEVFFNIKKMQKVLRYG